MPFFCYFIDNGRVLFNSNLPLQLYDTLNTKVLLFAIYVSHTKELGLNTGIASLLPNMAWITLFGKFRNLKAN